MWIDKSNESYANVLGQGMSVEVLPSGRYKWEATSQASKETWVTVKGRADTLEEAKAQAELWASLSVKMILERNDTK